MQQLVDVKKHYRQLVNEAGRSNYKKSLGFDLMTEARNSQLDADTGQETLLRVKEAKRTFQNIQILAFGDYKEDLDKFKENEQQMIASFKELKWIDPFKGLKFNEKGVKQFDTYADNNPPKIAYIPTKLMIRKILKVCVYVKNKEEVLFYF
jgi:hypothetical protein